MREAYIEKLDRITIDLAAIARRVSEAVDGASRALLECDVEAAERVISDDQFIDEGCATVEHHCFEILSLQQPVAGDLRMIVSALKMVAELERMGDLAAHVAKIARMRVPERAVPEEVEPTIGRMAQLATSMTVRIAEIIETRDVEAAEGLRQDDDAVDELRRTSLRQLLGSEWTHGVEAAVDVALIGRYFERIADHAVTMAGRVIFVVTGEQVA